MGAWPEQEAAPCCRQLPGRRDGGETTESEGKEKARALAPSPAPYLRGWDLGVLASLPDPISWAGIQVPAYRPRELSAGKHPCMLTHTVNPAGPDPARWQDQAAHHPRFPYDFPPILAKGPDQVFSPLGQSWVKQGWEAVPGLGCECPLGRCGLQGAGWSPAQPGRHEEKRAHAVPMVPSQRQRVAVARTACAALFGSLGIVSPSIPGDCSAGSPIQHHPPRFEAFPPGSRDARCSPRNPALPLGHGKLSAQL